MEVSRFPRGMFEIIGAIVLMTALFIGWFF